MHKSCRKSLHCCYTKSLRFSIRNLMQTGKSDTTLVGAVIRKSSTVRLTQSHQSLTTAMSVSEQQQQQQLLQCEENLWKKRILEFLTVCQTVASLLIVIVASVNLLLNAGWCWIRLPRTKSRTVMPEQTQQRVDLQFLCQATAQWMSIQITRCRNSRQN